MNYNDLRSRLEYPTKNRAYPRLPEVLAALEAAEKTQVLVLHAPHAMDCARMADSMYGDTIEVDVPCTCWKADAL